MKRIFSFHQNQLGMSLVEVLVATVMSAVLLMAVINTVEMMGASAKNIDTRDNRTALNQVVANSISFGDTCAAAFNNVTVNLSTAGTPTGQEVALRIPNINAGAAGTSDIIQGSEGDAGLIISHRLRVTSLNINSLSEPLITLVPPVTPTTQEVRRAMLSMTVNRYGSATAGGALLMTSILSPVMLTVDQATRRVITCYGVNPRSLKDTCVEMGGDYDETRTPPCRFVSESAECDEPGTVLVAIRAGVPYCLQLGEKCANGDLAIGMGINNVVCQHPLAASATPTTVTGPPPGP